MGTVTLSPPPAGVDGYGGYREWLLAEFFDHLCSYCLIRNDAVQVDHYEPRQHAPTRVDDPTNLLLACPRCNGRAAKSDYHPAHAARKRLPADRTGYLCLDVRVDDLALLYEIGSDGTLLPRRGAQADRAEWNADILLKLNLQTPKDRRRELIDLLAAAEQGVELVASAGNDIERAARRRDLTSVVEFLARHVVFFEVFGVAISAELRELLCAQRDRMAANR